MKREVKSAKVVGDEEEVLERACNTALRAVVEEGRTNHGM